ncbi:glucosaminidase domain-containing protein [Parabacteroides sp. GYB001]|uniref:glucosaminidase domain-containing protein n=1 Tax=Parabacteroides leei TaxID=2939491 RepID=UPI002017868A|nr:glucosaminidase domain-containing protein [Parabacteroides leei]MCL3854599.1 glucosaminidase domain-containing protein [Parabacteroides leei]
MTKQEFIRLYLSDASEAGGKYQINPIVILTQAAIESGWGESVLAREHNNLFAPTTVGRQACKQLIHQPIIGYLYKIYLS